MMVPDVAYDMPQAWVVSDNVVGEAACRASVEAVGGRVAATLPIDGAAQRLDEAAIGTVLVDLTRDAGTALDTLLDRLDAGARSRGQASVVALTPDLIDPVAARIAHSAVQILCAPDAIERAAATGLALSRRTEYRVRDRGELEPVQLRQLSEEVGRIARTLAQLSGVERPTGDLVRTAARPPAPMPTTAAIRAVIRARRLREQYFDAALFADPAWDMLLDLMAARIEMRPVAVSSLCIAAAVPPTTALRWIKTLTDAGLLVRIADPRDGRRIFIELSAQAAEGMSAYFDAVERLGGGVI